MFGVLHGWGKVDEAFPFFFIFFRVFDKINVRIFAYIKIKYYLCGVIKK